ncbi:LPD7 domain-containing protein [Methylobacter svalbardensis]|uniref:LPD7 domain-containing protein n=1 Tax=Methylobacter svalbardensis TaxID=3080016 RepID=UPI0030EE6882
MLERKVVFTLKKEKRTSDLTDIKKNEERELQVQLSASRIKAHAINAQLPPGSKLSTTDVNAILRAERDKKKRELKAKQVARQKAFEDEFDALEKKLQKHNSYHRWLADQSKQDGEQGDLAKHFYMESKMREQIDKQKRIEHGNESLHPPAEKRNNQALLSISKEVEKLGYKAYDNKTHIAYVKTDDYKVKFKDYGNTISISNQEDQSIRDAMILAIEKWGKIIKINGNSEFQAKAAKIAFESGVEKIQSDDKQALEIFRALKESSGAIDLAKQQVNAITAHSLVDNEKYIDYSDREACDKLNKAANLLKIAEKYGYSIEKQKGNAVCLIKGNKILNITISSDSDVFFMKCALGFDISGTAQEFIRREECINYDVAAQRLYIFNRSFPKNVEVEAHKAYDVAYVRHLFNTASNNAENIAVLANKGLHRHGLGNDSRVNENGEVFFAHRNAANNIVGFEIKSKKNSPMWFVKGGQKGIYHANSPQDGRIERVIITLNAIDAEALKRLETKQHPELLGKILYLSLGGTAGKRQIEHLKQYENVRMELHVTTDGEVSSRVINDLKNAFEDLKIVNGPGIPENLIKDLVWNREHHSKIMV